MSNHNEDTSLSLEDLAARLADDGASHVTDAWRRFTAAHYWTRRELWLNVLVDDEPTPVLVPIDDIPDEPDPAGIAGLMHLCGHLDDELGATSFAFLLVRPSIGGPSAQDRRWASSLLTAARTSGIPLEPIHHANAVAVGAFTPDELVGTCA